MCEYWYIECGVTVDSIVISIAQRSKVITTKSSIKIFLTHAHISHQPIKTRVWQYITNQNSWDVTAVFTYSHLNTAIDQWECAHYLNYFIISHIGQRRAWSSRCCHGSFLVLLEGHKLENRKRLIAFPSLNKVIVSYPIWIYFELAKRLASLWPDSSIGRALNRFECEAWIQIPFRLSFLLFLRR